MRDQWAVKRYGNLIHFIVKVESGCKDWAVVYEWIKPQVLEKIALKLEDGEKHREPEFREVSDGDTSVRESRGYPVAAVVENYSWYFVVEVVPQAVAEHEAAGLPTAFGGGAL